VPTVRHKLAALIGAVLLCSTVLLTGGSASALSSPVPTQATCYPLSTCPTVPPCVVGNVNAGTVTVGKTITFTLCGDFAPGSSVTITANGVVVFTKTPSAGAVTVVVTVTSQTVMAVGDPVNVAATCGTNTIVATGPSAAGGTGMSTGTFTLLCTSTGTTTGPLALTGTNVMIALLIALALIGFGVLLVVLQRKRRQTI
jgi:hypothetical protein